MKHPASVRIFRVLLQAKDLERSTEFFERLLGIPGRRVGGGRVYFDCGPVLLALLDCSAGEASPLPESIYFATSALEDVHRRAFELNCLSPGLIHNDPSNPAGEIVVRPWGERSFYAADPSGNPLCFVDERTLFTGTTRQVAALSAGPPRRRPRRTRSSRPRVAQRMRAAHRR
jgi:catechol 2,3-dioxygenase-like lactoylglutathione lyase family enzyme